MGSEAIDGLIVEVNFPEFASGFIDGVFKAIVHSSIQQMEAYGELIAAVSDSVDQFARDNVVRDAWRVSSRTPSAGPEAPRDAFACMRTPDRRPC